MGQATIFEAAVILGVSPDTVRRRIKRGELEAKQDPAGRTVVELTGVRQDTLPRSAPQPATQAAPMAEVSHLRELLAAKDAHITTLTAELEARRQEVNAAAEREAGLVRALHQQQALHAQASGIKLLPAADGTVAVPLDGEQPRRRWWSSRR